MAFFYDFYFSENKLNISKIKYLTRNNEFLLKKKNLSFFTNLFSDRKLVF